MDLLMFAADAVFNEKMEDMSVCMTPTKQGRAVLGEVTNMVNISPDKFHNSPLQALFTSPTLNTPNAKATPTPTTPLSNSGSRGVGRGNGCGKSLSCPSPGTKVSTPSRSGMSPGQISAAGLGRSPLTPMSNLKLLTRIASMEESLTSKKGLFQSQCENSENISPPVLTESIPKAKVPQLGKLRRHKSESQNQNGGKSELGKCNTFRKHPSSSDYPSISSPGNLVLEGNVGQLTPLDEVSQRSECSRKDKSLGLLSEKFLEHFPMKVSPLETPRRLVIDEVATELGTERRRVYDIINVLESLSMAVRVQKNMYQWTGQLHLEHTLARLKGLALKMDLHSQLHHLHHHHSNKDQSCQQFACIKTNINGETDKPDSRREKSLGVLCQKFVMLLLVSPWPHILSLEHAVRLVVGETGEDGERLRTRGRRLYDIANVLTSLGLVRRIPSAKSFKYIGPQIEACVSDEDSLGVIQRHSLLPSCVGVGSDKGTENVSCPGDHEVTPSTAPKPVQKRGRPRKLSPDFCASTLPVAKRSRLHRTRSEDTTCTKKETLNFTRHPSLHEICQVAEVEREKLLQKEQQLLQNMRRKANSTSGMLSTVRKVQTPVTTVTSSQPAKLLPTSLLQKYLGTTAHTRVPVALTFQDTQVLNQRQESAATTSTPSHLTSHMPTPSHLTSHMPTLSHLTSHMPTLSHLTSHMPTPSHLTSHMPTPSHLASHMPTPSHLASHTPTPSHLASHTPTPSHLASHTPTPSHLASHTPTPSHLASHMPTPSHLTSHKPTPTPSHLASHKPTPSHLASLTLTPTHLTANILHAQPFTLGQSFSQARLKPVQIGNKILYNNGGQEGAHTPVILTRGGQQHNSAIIRVITRSRKPVQQPEPSTVITVMPTNKSGHHNTGTPQQLFVQTDKGLQPLHPSLASIQRIQESNNHAAERNGFVEESHSKLGPFSIYTASGSQITLRKLSRVESEKGTNLSTQPVQQSEVVLSPASQPSFIKLPIVRPRVLAARSSAPTNLSTSTSHLRGWQPSPDGSSTDSELEEIFGDTFKFSRPKNLVIGNSSHDGLSSDKLVCQAKPLPRACASLSLPHSNASLSQSHTSVSVSLVNNCSIHSQPNSHAIGIPIQKCGKYLSLSPASENQSNNVNHPAVHTKYCSNIRCSPCHQEKPVCSSQQDTCRPMFIPNTSFRKVEPSCQTPLEFIPIDDKGIIKARCSTEQYIDSKIKGPRKIFDVLSNGILSSLNNTYSAFTPVKKTSQTNGFNNESVKKLKPQKTATEIDHLKWIKESENEVRQKLLIAIPQQRSLFQSIVSAHPFTSSLPTTSSIAVTSSLIGASTLPATFSHSNSPSLPGGSSQPHTSSYPGASSLPAIFSSHGAASSLPCVSSLPNTSSLVETSSMHAAFSLGASSLPVASCQSAKPTLPAKSWHNAFSGSERLLDELCLCDPATCLLHGLVGSGDESSHIKPVTNGELKCTPHLQSSAYVTNSTVMPQSQVSSTRAFIPTTAKVAVPDFSVTSTADATTTTTATTTTSHHTLVHPTLSFPCNRLPWPVSSTPSGTEATTSHLNAQYLLLGPSPNSSTWLEGKRLANNRIVCDLSSSTSTSITTTPSVNYLQYPCGKVLLEKTPQANHSDVTTLPPSSLSTTSLWPKGKKWQREKTYVLSTPDADERKDKMMETGHRKTATASRHCTTGKARRMLF
ncbi:hypothetical protein Pcinc_005326 [Petrolisthes cinctipes]|uniref:E2F/DP family winged-helix DNA-binding domain-containing protein n=1 Tax=Petrolisthes cinctipes TaxID=88211 RepID=A0AAE1KZF8_PETCI|nr:hypothetical protein Pcinc_005326 [Petrolisthes cinctipes]